MGLMLVGVINMVASTGIAQQRRPVDGPVINTTTPNQPNYDPAPGHDPEYRIGCRRCSKTK
jgi:hypothetical protein